MKNLKTNLLTASILSVLSVPLFAQKTIEVPLTAPGQPGKLSVNAIFSENITVRSHNKENVIVNYSGDEIQKGNSEAMKNGMKRISSGGRGLEVVEDNNKVEISSRPFPTNNLEMTVFVPRNFSVKLNTVQGDVKVFGVDGELEISAINGDIELAEISGAVLANSVKGDIKVDFARVTPNSPMSFTGVQGDMEISFPEDAKFTAKMKTEWGDIYTNFDMDIQREDIKPDSDSDKGFKISVNKWIIGKVNGGGAEFLFKTLHGDISIRKK